MATVLNEGQHRAEFVISEGPGDRSRAKLLLEADAVLDRTLKAGEVIGRKRGAVSTAAFAGNAGDGVFAATPVAGAGAKEGEYKLVIIEPAVNLGNFQVFDPDGNLVGTGVVASAFAGGGLSFTLNDGAADFVSGDGFTITVAVGTKYVAFDPAGIDGSEIARAILRNNVTVVATVDETETAYVRDCEVNDGELVFPTGITAPQRAAAIADLLKVGIIVRTDTV